MNIAQRIKELREKNKWSQEELAQRIERSINIVAAWEAGDVIPTIADVIKLSKTFSVSADYLIGEKENDNNIALDEENNSSVVTKKEGKPFFKKAWLWILLSALLIVTIGVVIILLNREVTPRMDQNGNPLFVDLTDVVYTNAEEYLGYHVSVKGKVFQKLGDNGETKGVQVWLDPDSCEQNLMIYYTTNEDVKEGDYIVCTGYIKEIRSYENAYGTELKAPLIISNDLKTASYIEVMSPTLSTFTPQRPLYGDYWGFFSIELEKIEFAENETRIYLSVINYGESALYVNVDSSFVIHGEKQYNVKRNYDANYEEVPRRMEKRYVNMTGVVTFPAIAMAEDDWIEYVVEINPIHLKNSDGSSIYTYFHYNVSKYGEFVLVD